MKNKKIRIDQFEIKGKPERRVKKGYNYFLGAIANFTIIFAVIGILASAYLIGYLGVKGGMNEVARQSCESLQAYVTDFPDSVVAEDQITKCGALGIEIE